MFGMGKLSDAYKFRGRSIPEVKERFDEALLRHQKGRVVMFRDRNLTVEAFINAVVMHFLDLGFDEQRRVIREYVARFEGMVTGEEGANPASAAAGEPAATPTKVRRGKANKGAG